jgi:hypothetical protein
MKNLANCTPSEFLKQTNLIRHSVERWLKVTDIMNIRKRMPKGMPELSADLSADEAADVRAKREEMMAEQVKQNMSAILDALLEKHPQETLELLALCSFVEPEDVDTHPISFYFHTFNDLISDEDVIGFFTSLTKLVQ